MVVHRSADLVENVLQLGRLRERSWPRVLAGGMPRHLMGGHVSDSPMAGGVFSQSHLGLGFISAGVRAVFTAETLLTSSNNKEVQ
jgi:hypothetical protein